mmetsp:Transcript_34641/g.54086  ORF Transcript_34641/g.54086 Transcript_34641/m.54086 type:complete len:284 (+) Transcript_34641:225-1076(+)|eukprot:CAMPEP_0184314076 /NCGR_PEP_ID=MMETSP1049-20130417/70852_1 /TAXON_ID=77928 /ORGANISM="Proteomonas sulcata, Strain CCMP704" /LENGTH=283 /DNA_ID=CAMNT_0026631795 /DNA_START=110 /DNA_END=961 /DNA_ORIENTATION=-
MREGVQVGYSITSGAFGHRGIKAQLEDVELQITDLAEKGPDCLKSVRSAFYAVFDGHAGVAAAQYAEENLPINIANKIETPTENENVRKAILDGFKETDREFIKLANEKGLKDGCTAVTVTVINDVMFIAWAGDSKAVLARREDEKPDSRLKVLSITKDHTCIVSKERERIVGAGGYVENNRVQGIMEVTRSIGDKDLKRYGVSSTPEIQRVTLSKRDEFMILACDGLWRVMDAKEVVAKTRAYLQEGKSLDQASMELVREAVRMREASDNVSALILQFEATQ